MKKSYIFISLFMISFVVFSFSINKPQNTAIISSDSLDVAKQMYVDQIKESIEGKENMPSDSVYQNIELFKEVPAGNLLNIMNKGFSNALGVGCEHCHNTSDWASNEKKEKMIAREMFVMSGKIRELLGNIEEIESENPVVNCTTCHRGEVVPATKIKN